MDLLEDWLAPTIQRELKEALKWKRESLNEENDRDTAEKYNDDGSNLRVHIREPVVVQICQVTVSYHFLEDAAKSSQFLNFVEPIKATLSDKRTRLNATISQSASNEYLKKHQKSFTKDTTGGLIQLLDFEIVATHLGTRADRLTLFVDGFKSLGCNGCGVSSLPRPIESPDKGCLNLLEELEEIRAQEKVNSNRDSSIRESSAEASSIQSQTALSISNDRSPDSQSFLVTQVPVARNIHPKFEQHSVAFDSDHSKTTNTTKSYVARVEIKQSGNASKGARRGLADTATSEVHNIKVSDDKLRESNKQFPRAPEKGTTTAAINSPMKAVYVDNTTPGAAHGKNDIRAIHGIHDIVDSHTAPKSIGTSGPTLLVSNPPGRPTKKRKLNARISSREVRVPRDQEALLSRKDSWIPAEPGQNEPRANVPIGLLEVFNEDADRRQERATIAQGDSEDRETLPRDEGLLEAQVSESESESDVASGEWPPSPDRNQLPPDSSPPDVYEAALHRDNSKLIKSPVQEPNLDGILSKGLPTSPNHETKNIGNKRDGDSQPGNRAMHPITLLTSSLDESTQSVTNKLSEVRTEGATDGPQHSESLQNQVHSRSISKGNYQKEAEMSSPEVFHSSHSMPDSDIEMTIPGSLHEVTKRPTANSPEGNFPSTAPLSKQPFTQVKRTPYADGHGHPEPGKPFTNGYRLMVAEGNEPSSGVSGEADSQVPCTTSTYMWNNNSGGPATNIENGNPKSSALMTDVKSSGECNRPSSRHSLQGKRLLQSDEEVEDGGPSWKRAKTNSSFSKAKQSSPRENVSGPLQPESSNITEHPAKTTTSASQYDLAKPTAGEDNGKNPASRPATPIMVEAGDNFGTDLTRRPSHNQHDQSTTQHSEPSIMVFPRISESNTSEPHDLHPNQIPAEIAAKPPGVNLPRDRTPFPVPKRKEINGAPLMLENSKSQTRATETRKVDTLADHIPTVTRRSSSISIEHGNSRKSPQIASHTATKPTSGLDALQMNESATIPSPEDFWKHFRSLYPDYTGTLKHFLSLCGNIQKLWKQDRLHKSMWDDFLIRSKIEYADHVRESMENGEDPLPYEKFYNEEIDEPKYRKKVLTPLNLNTIIRGDGLRNISSHTTSTASTPVSKGSNAFLSHGAGSTTSSFLGNASPSPMIDLTQEDRTDQKTLGRAEERSLSPQPRRRRRIPWMTERDVPDISDSGHEHTTQETKAHLPQTEPMKHPKKVGIQKKVPKFDTPTSVSGKSRSHKPAADARDKEADDLLPASWWQEEYTPFKKFMNSYLAIRPGNNNSYAKPEDIERGKREHHRKRTLDLNNINFANWKV